MKSPFVVAVLAIALAGAVGADPPHAAAQPAGQTFHIELNTLPGCYRYGCESLFSDFATKDITILLNGRQYLVQLTPGDRPAFPAHLLVVFAPGAKRPGNAKLAGTLKDPLSNGWLVSVARQDGTFTPYCSKDTLAQALAGASAAPSRSATKPRDLNSALATLDGFPGRRVLLVVNTRKASPPQWVSDAAAALAPVYVVDGGEQRRAYFWTDAWDGGLSEPMENWKTITKRAWNGGIMHEIKLPSAVKHIVADSRYDYDLSFSVPAPADASAPLPIRVELNERRTVTASGFAVAIPDSMRVGLYTVASEETGAPAEPTRVAVSQDLSVVWRCDFGGFPTVLFRIDGHQVLPRPKGPNGTVMVSYTASSGPRPANKRTATQATATAQQTLRLEASNLLGTEPPRSRSN